METKGTVLLYEDDENMFNLLPLEQRGILISAVLAYALHSKPPDFDDLAMHLAFEHIRLHIDRDAERYEEVRQRRREAGRNGGLAKVANASFATENLANVASASFAKHNVNVNDNDLKKSVSYDTPKESPKRFEPPSIEDVKAYAGEKGYANVDAERFCDFYESKGWMVGKNKMKDWKAAVRNWNRMRQDVTANSKRQDVTAKEKSFSNYNSRNTDYDSLIAEGKFG